MIGLTTLFCSLVLFSGFRILFSDFKYSKTSFQHVSYVLLFCFLYEFVGSTCACTVIFLVSVAKKIHLFGKKLVHCRELDDEISNFLDNLVLEMKSGASLRAGISKSIRIVKPKLADEFRKIETWMQFGGPNLSKNSDNSLKELYFELFAIEKRCARRIESLEDLRRRRFILRGFRSKVGSFSLRARIQSIFMVGVYIATVSTSLGLFGWGRIGFLLSWSAPIFLFGTIWVFQIGRRLKWSF